MKNLVQQNKEGLEKLSQLMYQGAEKINIIPAVKVLQTYEDFINSEELKEVHRGFQSWTSIKENMYDAAIVDEKGNVWVKYKIDGLNFIKKEQIGSSISNGGLIEAMMLPAGIIADNRNHYEKCEGNRKIWRQQGYVTLMCPYQLS